MLEVPGRELRRARTGTLTRSERFRKNRARKTVRPRSTSIVADSFIEPAAHAFAWMASSRPDTVSPFCRIAMGEGEPTERQECIDRAPQLHGPGHSGYNL